MMFGIKFINKVSNYIQWFNLLVQNNDVSVSKELRHYWRMLDPIMQWQGQVTPDYALRTKSKMTLY